MEERPNKLEMATIVEYDPTGIKVNEFNLSTTLNGKLTYGLIPLLINENWSVFEYVGYGPLTFVEESEYGSAGVLS